MIEKAQTAPSADPQWFVYILCCADGTLYTGATTDVQRRLREHNSGKRGARYTRSRRPVSLLAFFRRENRSDALREENRIKGLSREQKLALCASSEHRQ